jgi:CxxC motif-containing protein (DUF1111 family)
VIHRFVFSLLLASAITLGVAALYFLSSVQAQNRSRLLYVGSNIETSTGVTLSPMSANFNAEPLGLKVPAQKFTLTNNGATALTITSIQVTSGFSRFNTCPSTLDVGASCTVSVNFVPSTGGPITGTLTIIDTDPTSPQVATLTGTGLAPGVLGGPLANLSSTQSSIFNAGFLTFIIKWDPFRGLGPVYTQAGCFTCHGGGIAKPSGIPGNTSSNTGTRYGKFNPDGTFNYLDGTGTFPENDGGPTLHPQTVASLPRRSACKVTGEVVPPDATVVSLIRSPQLFGMGLIDSIPEATILANQGDKGMGINGVANMVPDQNGQLHAGRFGQKASVPNLLFFTISAMFNELGITSPIFPNEHIPSGNQIINSGCEMDANNPEDPAGVNSVLIYQYQALLGPAPTQPLSASAQAGKIVFENIGCNLCHVETMQSDASATVFTDLNGGNMGTVGALANQPVALYSDLLLHDMGPSLAGGIPLGQATLTQWRTTPLWGLSTRLTLGLLHDMRAKGPDNAIRAHGGEATDVINNYVNLSSTDHANLFAFLKSL